MDSDRQLDHDILIEIRTLAKANQESFIKHCEEDAGRFLEVQKTLSALHRRVDGFTFSGIMAIIVVVLAFLLRK